MAVITRYLQKAFPLQKNEITLKKIALVGVTFFLFSELMIKELTKAASLL
jgi:hypothetical protein